MTVPFPLDAFDHAHAVTPKNRRFDRAKLVSIAITAALHVLIVGAALTAVHVSRSHIVRELTVQITPEKIKPAEDLAPRPVLAQPSAITVTMPDVTVQSPVTPVTVQPPVAKPVPPAPIAAPQKAAGETRDTFLGRLLAQLNRFKQYPRAARSAHIEGVVMLHFVMDAQGKVLRFEIAKSSGRPVLDAEALALIQRAQPLPAIPADFSTRTLDAVVPIEFSLKS